MNDRTGSKAGTDYPRTYQEFVDWFGDDAACRRYLQERRWPQGFQCPQCGKQAQPWTTARGYLHCRDCGAEVSVTAGTVFERTRISLKTWFAAMWFVTSQKDGANALGLQRVLGFGSYQTAWTWLHKLRHAMVRPGRDRLRGRLEVDETYVGGSRMGGQRGRGSEGKEIVVIAVEVHSPKGFGRVRMRRIPDVSGSSLVPFVCDVAEKGSAILTDGWGGYNQLSECGYRHERVILSDTGDPAHISMPGVHRIAALLKRWLLSTHQGSFSGKHLEYYLDEYTFRFNRRKSQCRGLLFYRLVEQAVQTAPLTYRQIVARKHNL
jgi:transposase-like protein/transcription elongation factor Elf1